MTRRSSSFSHIRDGVGLLYRPGPGRPELTKREKKRERESSISRVMWKTNKAHTQDLYRSQRHRASSQGGLESLGKKVSSVGFHALMRMKTKQDAGDPGL